MQWFTCSCQILREHKRKLTLEQFSLITIELHEVSGPPMGSPTSTCHWPTAPIAFLCLHLRTEKHFIRFMAMKSIMSNYILLNKTHAAYQQAHLFSGHILLPFLFHLQRGSVSSFSLGIKFAHTYHKAHIKTMHNSHAPLMISSPN